MVHVHVGDHHVGRGRQGRCRRLQAACSSPGRPVRKLENCVPRPASTRMVCVPAALRTTTFGGRSTSSARHEACRPARSPGRRGRRWWPIVEAVQRQHAIADHQHDRAVQIKINHSHLYYHFQNMQHFPLFSQNLKTEYF